MAKLDYQRTNRDRNLSRQPIVNRKNDLIDFHPMMRRKDVIRFGKYKNYKFSDIPIDYIKWAISNISDKLIVDRMIAELKHREKGEQRANRSRLPTQNRRNGALT